MPTRKTVGGGDDGLDKKHFLQLKEYRLRGNLNQSVHESALKSSDQCDYSTLIYLGYLNDRMPSFRFCHTSYI